MESEHEETTVKCSILNILLELDISSLNSVEQWISSQSYKKDLEKKRTILKSQEPIKKIVKAIKTMVPLGAEMESEKIEAPTVGDQADCNKINTYHVDEFLYKEEELEKLESLQKYYCKACHSRDVEELTLISHSMSLHVLQYVFNVLLPKDLDNKQLLDVGSRIGAVIFTAYHCSNASLIVGVEMNKECCEVQERIIDKFAMDPKRIKVVHSDVTERSDIVNSSDIIVINVLDFFVDVDKHKEIWYFFKKHLKKGSFLVCNRSMMDTLDSLDLCEEFYDWLSVCKPNQIENEVYFDIETCSEVFLYTVN